MKSSCSLNTSAAVCRFTCDRMERTVLSCSSGRPSRKVPRTMLSFFEGRSARAPSGEITTWLR
ncbi:hypothetical protein D9M68_772700 [compost metagenome]